MAGGRPARPGGIKPSSFPVIPVADKITAVRRQRTPPPQGGGKLARAAVVATVAGAVVNVSVDLSWVLPVEQTEPMLRLRARAAEARRGL